MPAVSVIVNLFNGRATLAETLNSVLAQTFTDWELIVWDDASTDGGGEVVRQYSDPRLRYVRSPAHVSLGEARRAAVALATGEWIAFLDQDDLWLPDKLELQLARAAECPDAALLYGRTVRFYPSGGERDYDQAHEYLALPEGDIFRELFAAGCFIAMTSAMFRRSAIEAVGGIPESIRIIPDYWLYTAVAQRFPAAAVQTVVCRYRMHGNSASHRHVIAVHEEALRLMDMWRDSVPSNILAQCKRLHSTQIALAEMRAPASLARGLRRLLGEGSVVSQLARPFLYVFHVARRNLIPPYWKRAAR